MRVEELRVARVDRVARPQRAKIKLAVEEASPGVPAAVTLSFPDTGTLLREIIRIAPRGRHIAVEPLPHLASTLRTVFPTVEVHEIAVSDHTGREMFIHVENDPAYRSKLGQITFETTT